MHNMVVYMDITKISSGKDLPNNCNVVIEISANAGPIKYEFCKDSGMLLVDRVMQTSMSYPCNYGFVPHTLSGDGDPVDVLVHTNFPIALGSVISVKPIGVLITEDEKGSDEKILAVPTDKVDPFFASVNDIADVPPILLEKITHFFENYKKLEKNKWVKLVGWKDSSVAKEIIVSSVERYKSAK
jgi:inorganic pyrophosphatase